MGHNAKYNQTFTDLVIWYTQFSILRYSIVFLLQFDRKILLNLLQSQFCEYHRSLQKDTWRRLMRSLMHTLHWTDKHIYAIMSEMLRWRRNQISPKDTTAGIMQQRLIVNKANMIAWRLRIMITGSNNFCCDRTAVVQLRTFKN